MVTDDERREVARRLRRVADKYDGVACTIVEGHLGIEFDERFIGGSVYTSESVKRLSDLIDPDTTTDTTKSPELTTKCDRDALLALAGEMKRMPQCELCPAEIVDCSAHPDGCPSALLDYYARRIRNALGVSE